MLRTGGAAAIVPEGARGEGDRADDVRDEDVRDPALRTADQEGDGAANGPEPGRDPERPDQARLLAKPLCAEPRIHERNSVLRARARQADISSKLCLLLQRRLRRAAGRPPREPFAEAEAP